MTDEMSQIAGYSFFFTENGFYMEKKFGDEEGYWDGIIKQDRYKALFLFGFKKKPDGTDTCGSFLFRLAGEFVELLTRQPDIELLREKTVIEPDELLVTRLLDSVPFANGQEYVNNDWISGVFRELNRVFSEEIADYNGTVAFFLAEKGENLTVPERVFFHLVENDEPSYPFAFLATYGTKMKNGRVKHVPLKYALTEYKQSNDKLLSLLACLNRAAAVSPLIASFTESGELFYPLRLNASEAFELLKALPDIEKTGIIFRVPNWWRRSAGNISLTLKLGADKPAYLGLQTLINVKPELVVDGVALTREEVERLLSESEGLAFLKGKWVSIDHERLKRILEEFDKKRGDITLLEAMRSGINMEAVGKISPDIGGEILNGTWLHAMLEKMRNPSVLRRTKPPAGVKAVLRNYQNEGYEWLRNMEKLGFGACLADDMGLGKTVQVLAFLEKYRSQNKKAHVLLVVPASLLGNWQKEKDKFVPAMPMGIIHASAGVSPEKYVSDYDCMPFLNVTTYGMTVKLEKIAEYDWDMVILDEAQAIKNPTTKQTRAIKGIKAGFRLAMTGTPIENDLTNLWSLFDFLNKGLLGSSREFDAFAKGLQSKPEGYARLKNIIAPFMLRRLKTDKRIISDLPDKLESVEYVTLSSKQKVLYRDYIRELEDRIENSSGMERRGIVLAALTKLKQICNHPDEYLGQEAFKPSESGKFEYLAEICKTIKEKRERVLVFTQFKELTAYLDDFLSEVFGRRGFVLHGGTRVAKRNEMVEKFQSEQYIPYMVISVKAGGTGLNLTNANHVVHFDRWWNPAVENQATDRAFRIGQTKKVMVHKLVSKGTLEERIDNMLRDKSRLAENVVGSSGEGWITEMSNAELLSCLRLEQ